MHYFPWWGFWWLIFPIMWWVFGIIRMLARHNRRKDALDVLRTYAAQGKEPPAELLKAINGEDHWRGYRRGPYRGPRAGIILASLAVAFVILSVMDIPGGHRNFLVPAVILGALSVGFLVASWSDGGRRDRYALPPDENAPDGK